MKNKKEVKKVVNDYEELDKILLKRLKSIKYFEIYYWIIFVLAFVVFFSFLAFFPNYKFNVENLTQSLNLINKNSHVFAFLFLIMFITIVIWYAFNLIDFRIYRKQEKFRKKLLQKNFYKITANYKKICLKEQKFFFTNSYKKGDTTAFFLYIVALVFIVLDSPALVIPTKTENRDSLFLQYSILGIVGYAIWLVFKITIQMFIKFKNIKTDFFDENEKNLLLTSKEILSKQPSNPWKYFLDNGKWIYRLWISENLNDFLKKSFTMLQRGLENTSKLNFNKIIEKVKNNSKHITANDVVTDIHSELRKNIKEEGVISEISEDFFKAKLKEIIDTKKLKIVCFQTQASKHDFTNAYILGSSGSGKTSKIIIPTIIANANAKIQPSFFISDPKNELYQKQSEYLEKRGYSTYLLNLSDLTNSNKWNPLRDIYEKFLARGILTLFLNQYEECWKKDKKIKLSEFCFDKKEINETIKEKLLSGLEHLNFKKVSEKIDQILFDDVRFTTIDELKQYLNLMLDTQIAELINLFSKNIFSNKINDNLVELAQRTFEGALYNLGYLVEKSVINKEHFVSIEKFNIFSLMNLINQEGFLGSFFEKINKKEFEIFNEKLEEKEIKSKKLDLKILKSRSDYINLLPIWKSSDETKELVLRTLNIIMKPLIGDGIKGLTSYSEISLREISSEEKPVAIFLGINVVDDNYHPFATLFINLLHHRISTKAKNSENQKLKNGFMFILEEFGNLPAIPGYENILTTCRSENIKFMSIVQSNNQLNDKYDKEIILGNSDLKIFLKTSSESDIEWISEVIGKKGTKFKKIKTLTNNDIKNIESGDPWHFNIVIADNKKYLMRLRPWFVGIEKSNEISNSPSYSRIKNNEIYYTDERVIDYFDWKENFQE